MDDIVRCDKCNNKFKIELRTRTINNILVQYFKCSNCNKLYIVSCEDETVKKLKYKFQQMISKKGKAKKANKVLRQAKERSDMLGDKIYQRLKELESN